jgi:hypothetical protein
MWGIGINWAHVNRWVGWLISYEVFVASALVLGWHLGPRLDEVLVVATLPAWVLVPYVLLCLLLVVLRVLWARALPISRRLLQRAVVVRQKLLGLRTSQ